MRTQGTVLGMREMMTSEVHSWVVRFEQQPAQLAQQGPANFLVGVAPPDMDPTKSLGEDGCGIGGWGYARHGPERVWVCAGA